MSNHQMQKIKRYQSLSDLVQIQTETVKYQDSVRPKYQERIWITDYQHQLYRTAMLGLKAYSKKELYKMSIQAKRKIIRLYERAQVVLNRWRQQLMNEMFEQLCSLKCSNFPSNPFQRVFTGTPFSAQAFGKTTDDAFKCNLTFAQLKISREQIIQKLILEKILPGDFYKLQKPFL